LSQRVRHGRVRDDNPASLTAARNPPVVTVDAMPDFTALRSDRSLAQFGRLFADGCDRDRGRVQSQMASLTTSNNSE